MGRRPTIPPFIRVRVSEIYKELLATTGKPPTAKDVHRTLLAEQGKRRFPVPLPELRTVQVILTKTRRELEEEQDVDRQWNVGVGKEKQIADEAIDDLLRISKWCAILGRKFTIREAQWAARLRHVLPFPIRLYWAAKYAVREQACVALNQPVDTTDLDAFNNFLRGGKLNLWLHHTALWLGAIPRPSPVPGVEGSLVYVDDYGRTCMWHAASEIVERSLGLQLAPPEHWPDRGPRVFCSDCYTPEWPEQADMVYALWLRYLSTGANWRRASRKVRESLARRLRAEVAVAVKDLEEKGGKEDLWEASDELMEEAGVSKEARIKQLTWEAN